MARVGKKRKSQALNENEENPKKLKSSDENGDGTPVDETEPENVEQNGTSDESDVGTKEAKDNEGTKSQVNKGSKKTVKKSSKENGKITKKSSSVPERKSSRVPPKKVETPTVIIAKKTGKKAKASTTKTKQKAKKEYEVEKVLKYRLNKKGQREFLVRWKGYKSNDDSWEPEAHLSCDELISELLNKEDKVESPAKKPKTTVKSKSTKKKSVKKAK